MNAWAMTAHFVFSFMMVIAGVACWVLGAFNSSGEWAFCSTKGEIMWYIAALACLVGAVGNWWL